MPDSGTPPPPERASPLSPPVPPRGFSGRTTVVVCALLALLYATLSYTAVRTKSATWDEPGHAIGAWVHTRASDYRMDFEDPPLWQRWAMLPQPVDALRPDYSSAAWREMPDMQWRFAIDTLFATPGTDGMAFINRSRLMMVLAGALLCAATAFWAWQLGGAVAAIGATALVALDPNLIGHGGLVNTDVAMALMMVFVAASIWNVGRAVTLASATALALSVGVALSVKLSAVLFVPIVILLLVVRVGTRLPWAVMGKPFVHSTQRLAAAAALLVFVAVVSSGVIWASYGFRFSPSPDPAVQIDAATLKYDLVLARFRAEHPMTRPRLIPVPAAPIRLDAALVTAFSQQLDATIAATTAMTAALRLSALSADARQAVAEFAQQASQAQWEGRAVRESAQAALAAPERDDIGALTASLQNGRMRLWQLESQARFFAYWAAVGDEAPDSLVRVLNVLVDYKVLPSPWLHGVLFVHANSVERGTFLLGQHSNSGWWYYFPLAVLFKTPVGALGALLAAGLVATWLLIRRREVSSDAVRPWSTWTLACLAVPFGVYLATAVTANLNIGLRHILCLYPLMYLAVGVVASHLHGRWPSRVRAVGAALIVVLSAETLFAWPNYVAYFNVASGGSRGGLGLLADSNLDWGQDLPLLKRWQDAHPDTPLALAYFGIADNEGRTDALPKYYGIKFVDLPPGRPDPRVTGTRVLAISATHLQGVYSEDFTAYRAYEPMAVLGGTIYLFDLRTQTQR